MEKTGNCKDTEHTQMECSRRDFIKNVTVVGFGTVFLTSSFGYAMQAASKAAGGKQEYSMILADYSKCTGCRTCETACSSFNRKQNVKGELLPGPGNPYYSNIKIANYNPDADIPVVCALCPDTPCVSVCPVKPDAKTGKKALYRDEKTGAIKNDRDRCTGCGDCAKTCGTKKTGVIISNPETGKPEGICTLCDGDPQCVKTCPFGALSFAKIDPSKEFYGMNPDKIAKELIKRWYNTEQ